MITDRTAYATGVVDGQPSRARICGPVCGNRTRFPTSLPWAAFGFSAKSSRKGATGVSTGTDHSGHRGNEHERHEKTHREARECSATLDRVIRGSVQAEVGVLQTNILTEGYKRGGGNRWLVFRLGRHVHKETVEFTRRPSRRLSHEAREAENTGSIRPTSNNVEQDASVVERDMTSETEH